MTSKQQEESKKWLSHFMADRFAEARAEALLKPHEPGDRFLCYPKSSVKVTFAPIKLVLSGTLRRRQTGSQWDPHNGLVEWDARSQELVDGLCEEMERVCAGAGMVFRRRVALVSVSGPLELAKQVSHCHRLADEIESLRPDVAEELRAQAAVPRREVCYDAPVTVRIVCESSDLHDSHMEFL